MEGPVGSRESGRKRRIGAALSGMFTVWKREPSLFWTGIVGLVLGVVGLVVFGVQGRNIPPEGDVAKAVSFNLAAGVYLLTIALIVPLARFSERGGWRWRGWHAALTLGALAIENVQVIRGQDPRFGVGSLVNNVLGCGFLVLGLGIIATFAAFAWNVMRRRAESNEEELLLIGVRYACIAALLAFAAGLGTSVVKGLKLGPAPDLMPLHALGFHALQAVPLTAYLLATGSLAMESARRWLHLAGGSWPAACMALGWQALRGRPVFEWGAASTAALVFFLAWGVAMARADVAWWKGGYSNRTFPRIMPHCSPDLIVLSPGSPDGARPPDR